MRPGLYFHTLRHLRPGQFYHRLRLRLLRASPDLRPAPNVRPQVAAVAPYPPRAPRMLGPESFRFLNEPGSLREGWAPADRSKLWCYHLHYFDDLNADDADQRRAWHGDLLRRWVAENPPGQGVGWEPYPTSLRIVNWVKYALRGGALPAEAVASLAVQTRWLRRRMERHLLGNHLLANAKALVFAGLFFEGEEAERWYAEGRRTVEREIGEQVLPDGGHFERSPMYHLVVLEDLLDLVNSHRAYGREAPPRWREAIARMQAWSRIMRHPDGEIPFFNDATWGVAPAPGAVDGYGARLGFPPGPEPGEGAAYLPDSGFCRLQQGEAVLFADVGSVGPAYLPGHAHAETLSLELSLGGQRILVNSGISEYGTGPERQQQRGTAAHNTVVVDATDSSEVWAGFRVARRARVTEAAVERAKDGALELTAAHDGYRRLPGKPVHKRHCRLTARGLTVRDWVEGSDRHSVAVLWHMHPGVAVSGLEEGFGLSGPGGECLEAVLGGFDESVDEPTEFHSGFGLSEPSSRLRGSWLGRLPAAFETRFSFGRGG